MASSREPHVWSIDVLPPVETDALWEKRLLSELTGELVRWLERDPAATEVVWNWRLFSARARRVTGAPWDGGPIRLEYVRAAPARPSRVGDIAWVLTALAFFALGAVMGTATAPSASEAPYVLVVPAAAARSVPGSAAGTMAAVERPKGASRTARRPAAGGPGRRSAEETGR